MKPIWTKRIAVTLTLLSLATAACAQYVWLDDKGTKQYSDMPPPASVPAKRILKQPRQSSAPLQTSSDSGSNNADNPAKNPSDVDKTGASLTTPERNADFQKRRAEQAAKDAKAAEEAKNAANKAKNCENARNYNRSLASGARIATTDQKGERAYISDGQREKEVQETQNVLKDCK